MLPTPSPCECMPDIKFAVQGAGKQLNIIIIMMIIFIEIYSQADVRSVQFNTNENKLILIRPNYTMQYYITVFTRV